MVAMLFPCNDYANTQRDPTRFCSAFTGGSSMSRPAPPNLGITKHSRSVAVAFNLAVVLPGACVSSTLEYVHNGLPNVDSQAGLILVIPVAQGRPVRLWFDYAIRRFTRRTSDVHLGRTAMELMKDHKLGGRAMKQHRRVVDKHVLAQTDRTVRHTPRRLGAGIRRPGRGVDQIFSYSHLINVCRRQKLSDYLELATLETMRSISALRMTRATIVCIYLKFRRRFQLWREARIGGRIVGLDNLAHLGPQLVDFFHSLSNNNNHNLASAPSYAKPPIIHHRVHIHTLARTKFCLQKSLRPPSNSYAPTTLRSLKASLMPLPRAECR
jgi:hypothetical protein